MLETECVCYTICFHSWLIPHSVFMLVFLLVSLSEDVAGSPYDKESMAIIHLNNTTVMYLKEVTKFLALVCFLREESFERKGEHPDFYLYYE